MKGYTHITETEQRRIERLLASGQSVREISRLLHRSPGTISEEVKRNKVKGKYLARKARHKARTRRQNSKIQCLSVVKYSFIRDYTEKKIRSGWSPELVSGRLRKVHKKKDAPSSKAVYKFVYSVHGRRIEKYLPSNQWKRKGGPKRKRPVSIDGRKMISERPRHVEQRKEFGHFEMDFIESGRDGKGSLLVLVERKTRYPFLVYTLDRTTEHINSLTAETLRGVPLLSATGDNDISFQKHEELSALIEADVFFCDSYSSWQKGTVENRNREVRKRKLPKGTDLSGIPLARFMAIEHELRHRPMKVLNYKTPFEMWQEEMGKIENKKTALTARGIMVERLLVNEKCSA
jgi:IS30 family transposase